VHNGILYGKRRTIDDVAARNGRSPDHRFSDYRCIFRSHGQHGNRHACGAGGLRSGGGGCRGCRGLYRRSLYCKILGNIAPLSEAVTARPMQSRGRRVIGAYREANQRIQSLWNRGRNKRQRARAATVVLAGMEVAVEAAKVAEEMGHASKGDSFIAKALTRRLLASSILRGDEVRVFY
jgi:hypothetical protein